MKKCVIIIITKKSNDLENSFDEEYEDVLKPYIKMDKKIIKFDDI